MSGSFPKVSLLALLIVFCVVLSGVNFNPESTIVFGQTKAISDIKKVHVGDIDIAYKMFGKGDPIILISGVSRSFRILGFYPVGESRFESYSNNI